MNHRHMDVQIEITGLPQKPQAGEILRYMIHSANPTTGQFEYSYPLVNRLWVNSDWLCVPSDRGPMVVAEPDMSFSALHYVVADLDPALHTYELIPRDPVILSLDARHSGFGNASCGPGVLPQYEIPPGNIQPAFAYLSLFRTLK